MICTVFSQCNLSTRYIGCHNILCQLCVLGPAAGPTGFSMNLPKIDEALIMIRTMNFIYIVNAIVHLVLSHNVVHQISETPDT